MKKRNSPTTLRPGGILRWSTAAILAGGLASCDRSSYVATPKDVEMAKLQEQIDTLDAQKLKLMNGEVANNFHIPRVGYYHANARNFFEHPYGFQQEKRYFVDGVWKDQPGPADVAASRPSPEALKKVEAALTEEQKTASGSSSHNSGGGFGMGNALMMYWLLSGNRGMFSPGAGFQQAQRNAGTWQQGVDRGRENVRTYASSNPGYNRVVNQARASGAPVKAGQSVRGGFGSSGSSGSATRSSGGSGFSHGG
ncbi:MAG: hypothetical protein EOP88_04720 [Verrucomicrobiaceae bacterium]|nr:MAG: hypothetical protein EOP88_04720 [Verrucomicrobiaceae bacterium]